MQKETMLGQDDLNNEKRNNVRSGYHSRVRGSYRKLDIKFKDFLRTFRYQINFSRTIIFNDSDLNTAAQKI